MTERRRDKKTDSKVKLLPTSGSTGYWRAATELIDIRAGKPKLEIDLTVAELRANMLSFSKPGAAHPHTTFLIQSPDPLHRQGAVPVSYFLPQALPQSPIVYTARMQ